MKKPILLMLITIVFYFSCHHDENVEARFTPAEGKYGTMVKVFDHGLDSLKQYPTVFFQGIDDWVNTDSIRYDTVYFTIPFGVESGKIHISSWPDSIILNDFQVNELGFDDIQIKWSELNYTISEHRATVTIVESNTLSWSVDIQDDTVHVIGDYQTGDVRYEYHLLLKNLGNDILPEIIDAYTILFNDWGGSGSVVNFPMTNGLVCIQDWKPEEKISGRVMALPWWKNNYIFYFDFSED